MIDAMGIIVASNISIPPLTDVRSATALPIAGGYRIIDFVLSSMADAGIQNIGVATEANYSSLMDHIKSGAPWDLNRKNYGLNILPPNIGRKNGYEVIRGDLDILAGIKEFIRRSRQTYVILSLGNNIYNIDFEKVLNEHIENQADITIIYKDMKSLGEKELSRFTLLDVDENNCVTDIEVCPYYPKSTCAGIDVFVMEKALLESIVDECSARGSHDFIKDAIAQKLSGLRVFGYEHSGYTDKIDSMKSYFNNNMKFLNEDLQKELLHSDLPVYTKNRDLPPSRYGSGAVVVNSYISDGCVIEGTVIDSVLSGNVIVKKGAVVKNSILMQSDVIEEDVNLEYVVLDKEVTVTAGRKLIGQENYPLPVAKGTVI
ncbi:MAG: glucose-1-phosphate adenylyltransferase subunit GlgD [Clostridiales bacterium]|nr:glucose-1-phosphate adenylyltransferase subunit GlgD [Clostridiales bacterium]